MPAVLFQQPVNASVAVSAILRCQSDNGSGQRIFISTAPGRLALCRAVLAEHHAGTALGYLQFLDHMINLGAAARGA